MLLEVGYRPSVAKLQGRQNDAKGRAALCCLQTKQAAVKKFPGADRVGDQTGFRKGHEERTRQWGDYACISDTSEDSALLRWGIGRLMRTLA
jgi:hypothetical protein